MAIRSARDTVSQLKKLYKRRRAKQLRQRGMQVEHLEDRRLLAVGPRLITVEPSAGGQLQDGDVLNTEISEIRFRFDVGQEIDASTLNGIRLTQLGDLATSNDDVVLAPGFIGVEKAPGDHIVVMRFAESLVDDAYRIDVLGAGANAVRNVAGEPVNAGVDVSLQFELHLGAKVIATVPQPVTRLSDGSLVQARNQIEVYFNEELDPSDASTPAFYRLIYTADTADNTDGVTVGGVEAPFLPTNVDYSYDPASGISKSVLTYSDALDQLPGLPPGTKSFRLRVGTNEATPRPPEVIDLNIEAASDFNTNGAVFIRFSANLETAETFGTSPRVFVEERNLGSIPTLVSARDNQVFVTLNSNATAPATAQDVLDAVNGNEAARTLLTASISGGSAGDPAQVVVSNRGINYSPLVLTGLGSSFATATDLDVFDIRRVETHSKLVKAAIDAQQDLLDFPGAPDEPGHRDIPADVAGGNDQHINPAFGADSDLGVTTILYNFRSNVGVSPEGDPVTNFITGPQKQRIREALAAWSQKLGVQFLETSDLGLTFATADPSALDPYAPDVVNYAIQKPDPVLNLIAKVDPEFAHGMLILDSSRDWRTTTGDDYYQTAMVGIGFLLGLGRAGDLPEPTTMAFGAPVNLPNAAPPDTVTPGNQDIVHGQYLYRPDSNDIDLYRFAVDLDDAGQEGKTAVLAIETFAERQANASLLDSLITLYREETVTDANGNVVGITREVVARNDDYFSEDSYIEVEVTSGTYFLQVTASGNVSPNPEDEGTGLGGTTQGSYELRFDLRPGVEANNTLRDRDEIQTNGPGTPLDGDADGKPGGAYNYWFRAASAADTVFVDKSHTPLLVPGSPPLGSIANPFNEIDRALATTQPGDIVRIVGNAGADRNPLTLTDNLPYEIGASTIGNQVLVDGVSLEVPQNVTVMVDSGAILKLRKARIGVGSSTLTANRSAGALQVLGTPEQPVYFTSWLDETIGLDRHQPSTVPTPGDWGGIRFRADLDNAEARFNYENEGIFLNWVNFADIRYGGGRLTIDSVEQVIQPVAMIEARPTVSNNRITFSADAALSAGPNSFEETNFHAPRYQLFNRFTSEYQRVGPDIHDNLLVNNSTNALFVNIQTAAGQATRVLTSPARFDDTDVVHVIAENLQIQGTPGAPLLDVSRPQVDLVSLTPISGGSLAPATYTYKVVFFDANGFEGRPSEATAARAVSGSLRSIRITNLPPVTAGFVGRRIYRSAAGGSGPYRLVAELNASSATFTDTGAVAGPQLQGDPPSVRGVTSVAAAGGALLAGVYNYRVTYVDADGIESPASDATVNVSVAGGNASVQLSALPTMPGAARRIYRSSAAGGTPYVLAAELSAAQSAQTTLLDDGDLSGSRLDLTLLGVVRAKTDARLRIDPGIIVKLQGARIEASFGSQFIAEGTEVLPVVFTSSLDDRFGAGGTFDTTSDGNSVAPAPGDWGGIYIAQTAEARIDHALLAFGGGDTRIEGTFVHFNVLEVHQADLRLANSTIEDNADGIEAVGGADTDRIGRGLNEPATIFVRGAQPVLIGNVIRDNEAQALTIDVNSFTPQLLTDPGRATGLVDVAGDADNRGPFVRGNVLENNPNNGMTVRGGILTTQVVFDDTDIVHAVFEELIVPNLHTYGGLRIQSSPTASLVVKLGGGSRDGFDPTQVSSDPFEPHLSCNAILDPLLTSIEVGYPAAYAAVASQSVERITQVDGSVVCSVSNSARFGVTTFAPSAGLTATGTPLDINDRIGGIVQLIGQPGFPVVLTSFHDDTVGSGFKLDGAVQRDTNNNQQATTPQPADWRSVRLEQYSSDRNVNIILERETPAAPAPGVNATIENSQFLGELATDEFNGDDNLRLGFELQGLLNARNDVDVYSFTAEAGTEVWLDIDKTSFTLNSVVELIDTNGNVIARSDDSLRESDDPRLIFHTSSIPDSSVGPLQKAAPEFQPQHASGLPKDFFSINALDAGMRVILPGVVGTRSTYHVRVRSFSPDITDVTAGQTAGAYQLQVRLREADEFPGSSVRNAEIRYAMNGIEVSGLPAHSPLLGEVAEDELAGGPETNNQLAPNYNVPGSGPQDLGNILASDRAVVSIAGRLSLPEDVDFFEFQIDYPDTGNAPLVNYVSTVFDIDYADGLGRANTSLTVFDEWGRVVLFAEDSNIADDQLPPLADGDLSNLSTGSAGVLDPFIGPVALPRGTYYVAVSSNAFVPQQLLNNPSVRREPLDSVHRIVEDHIQSTELATAGLPDVTEFLSDDAIEPLDPNRVTLFVVQDVEGADDQSDLAAIDPLTGQLKWEHLSYLGNVEDITTRIDGGVYGFSTPDADPAPNDFFTGLLQGVSTSRPQFIGSRDDGILTYEEDPLNPGLARRSDVGIRFNAAAFGVVDNQEVLLAVGDRGDKDLRPSGPDSFVNLLYRIDPRTGAAISAPQTPRTGAGLLDGGATNVVERGALDTNVNDGPGGTINGLEIVNGVVYGLSDSGGLFVVNDPLGLLGPATLTYVRDILPLNFPTDQFGVLRELEPNDNPAGVQGQDSDAPQNLDGDIWTQRDNPNIQDSTTIKHISIENATGDHGFLEKFVQNQTGSLEDFLGGLRSPQGMVIGPDGNLYITSYDTSVTPAVSQVLRFDGTTGEYLGDFVPANAGGLDDPRGLIFDADGDLLVSSFTTNQILRFNGATGLFDGVFATNSLNGPTGLTYDSAGNLYVANESGDLITRYAPSGLALPAPGQTGAVYVAPGVGNLLSPEGLAFGPDGNLYVNSAARSAVLRFEGPTGASPGAALPGPLGVFPDAAFVPDGSAGLNNPLLGIEFDAAGRLYVGSQGNDSVLRFDAGGSPVAGGQFVPSDRGGLDEPTDLLFHDGHWLVISANTDAAVHDAAPTAKVLRYTASGGFVDSLAPHQAGGLDAPRDAVFGPDGNLYVTSAAVSDSVLKYDGATGEFLGAFVSDGSGGLNDPFGLAFGPGGDLYVASQGTNRILRYDGSTGAFVSVFASGAGAPRGITFDASGRLYVSSLDNDSVLRYSSTGSFLGFFVASGRGGLVDPAGLQFGPDGNLYVASEGTNQVLRYNGQNGAFIDAVVSGVPGLAAPMDVQFAQTPQLELLGPGNYLFVTSSATNSIFRFNGDTGALVDTFVPAGNEGLNRPVGMAFRSAASGGGELFVTSSASDEVFRYDIDSRATFDYYEFSVDQDGTQVIIDIDTGFDDGEPGLSDTILFLVGANDEYNDDFSKFAGGGGSQSSLDAILGGDPNNPLILDVGTYIVVVAEYDAYDGLAKGEDPVGETNPLDRNDRYTLHISMTQHDDSADGPVVARDFEGLATRPRPTGGFEDILFAVDTLGNIFSLATDASDPTNPNLNGVPTPFFLGDDPHVLATGADHARGLSLSTTFLHVTDSRQADPGHGLAEAFDNSRGDGPVYVAEIEPNNTVGSAHDLELERWTLGYDSNIGDDFDDDPITINTSTFLPHVSVNGTGDGSLLDGTASRDLYSFEVTEANSYVQLEIDFSFDIQLRPNTGQPGNFPDDATLPYGEGLMDAQLILYDSQGNIIALNDNTTDFQFGDGGATNTLDPDNPPASQEPYIDLVLQPGTYIVEVTKFDPETFNFFVPPEDGDQYTLQVSVENHPVDPGAEKTDGGFSFAFGTSLTGPITNVTPTSDVQITSPRHGLLGGETVYVEGVRGIRQANGTYAVNVLDEDTFELVNADGTDDPFSPDGPYQGGGVWRLIEMPEDMTGAINSSTFSLAGYSAADKPVLYFNYMANLSAAIAADAFRVSIIEDGGPPQTLLLKSDLDLVVGATGDTNPLSPAPRDVWRQARVELDDFAGQDNLQIRFEFDTLDLIPGGFEGVFLDDFVVGFAERGEMVSNARNDGLFALDPDVPADEVLVGEYQLEIRRGSAYGVSQYIGGRGSASNSLQLTTTFDTNDRFGQQITIVAPDGGQIAEGDEFTISDGNLLVTFEFDSDGQTEDPGAGNALVAYQASHNAAQVAASILATINNGSVQSGLQIQAGPGGLGRVDLFGNPTVQGIAIDVHNETGDSNAFRDQGQLLIQSNFIDHARDYGIVADAGQRDSEDRSPVAFLAAHPGAVRNLQVLNNDPVGGIARGVTIENNVVASEGLGGIHVAGDIGVWELVPPRPVAYPDQYATGATSGDNISDGSSFIIEAYGMQVRFEFEDISGDSLANGGSNVDGGNGWQPGSVPIFFRHSNGYLLIRGVGYSQAEMVYAIREAINSSILVTNGTSQTIQATPYFSRRLGTELLGADPALYLEGVTRVIGGPFAVSRRVPLQQSPQAFARVVNNTVYGQDGTQAFFPGSGQDEPNDIIAEAVRTNQGSANQPTAYISTGSIGDGVSTPEDLALDVDLYQIQMAIGDRVVIDVDANEFGSALDPVVRLFNAQGVEVAISDNNPAPGETQSFDPYLDFTVSAGGTYYVGVSAARNSTYSAVSLGGRSDARSRGDYTVEIDVRSQRDWVLATVDGAQVPDGSTIEVSDRTRTVVFELDTGNGVAAGNVPIVYDATPIPGNGARGTGYRPPEMAVVIAAAINAEFPGAVMARALGGVQGQTAAGPRYNLETNVDFRNRNFGHDYDPTRIGYGQISNNGPFATGERFVVIEGAANVTLGANSPFSLGPDPTSNNNSNQLIPERGIYLSQRTSATLLNNVLVNLNTGVLQTDSPTTTMGASLFQNNVVDDNINPLNESFSITLGPTEPVFFNEADGNFYPARFSRVIDSSIDSLEDRNNIATLTQPLGISPSPILAPDRDAAGQLRVDDPEVDPPDGFGGNVFKDRGGIDRADFAGPLANLVNPLDNDSAGRDQDLTATVVQLKSGALQNISVRLEDGSEINEVDRGIGVNDASVSTEKVTITQNGDLLFDGVDYTFDYDPLSNTIRLTHISGVWPNDSVYVVELNNSDRFVFAAPDGSQQQDGDTFFVRDRTGHTVGFEFESGYSMTVAEPLTLHVPQVGVAAGNGIADGQRFIVGLPSGQNITFEYDVNSPANVQPGNRRIDISGVSSAADVATRTALALGGANLGLTPSVLPSDNTAVHLGAPPNYQVDLQFTNLTQSGRAGVVSDGNTFVVGDGVTTVTFEFEDDTVNNGWAVGNRPIHFRHAFTRDEFADAILQAIVNSGLNLTPTNFGDGLVHLGGEADAILNVAGTPTLRQQGQPGVASSTRLLLPGRLSLQIPPEAAGPGGIADGQFLTIDDGVLSVTFEFEDLDVADGVTPGNIQVGFTAATTQNQLATILASAIRGAGLGLFPVNQGNGVILLNANVSHVVNTNRTTVTQFGQEGGVRDGETFVISNGVITETFEFDNNGVVQSGNRRVLFSPANPPEVTANSMIAAIGLTSLGLNPVSEPGGIVILNDTSLYSTDVSGSSLIKEGVPGGAIAIPFLPDSSFDAFVFAGRIIDALENSALENVVISSRGQNTFFVDGAESISGDLDSFFVGSIDDLAENDLQANQSSNKTQFTILTEGVELDFGDAPDPTYPTLFQNDGARHAVVGDLYLGVGVDTEPDGKPSLGSNQDAFDDGVVFQGAFNSFVTTPVTVTASESGLLDAWFDFNADGDWDDVGEQVFRNRRVVAGANALEISTPLNAAQGLTVARFRISTSGDLQPFGLAANGEVEDYSIEIIPGTPPEAIDDPDVAGAYATDEDTPLVVTTPNVLENDFDVENDPLQVDPAFVSPNVVPTALGGRVLMAATGEFSYDPTMGAAAQALAQNQVAFDTFTYRAYDGFLFSNLATVSIRVTGVNDAPTTNRVSLSAIEDGPPVQGNFSGDDVDSDDNGSSLVYSIVNTVSEGTLTNNGNGTFTFNPGLDFQYLALDEIRGVTFTYVATDRHNGVSDESVGTISVRGVNDQPVVSNVSVTANQDGAPVLGSFDGDDVDSDDDRSTLNYAILSQPSEGSFVNNFDGTFDFDPGSGFGDLGQGEFRDVTAAYAATDRHGSASGIATLTARVFGANDPPVAVNDPRPGVNYTTNEDTALIISSQASGLLGNDFDPDGDVLQVVGAPLTTPSAAGASVTINSDGTFTFDPLTSVTLQRLVAGASMQDTFEYTITDGLGGFDSATATVLVTGLNDRPVANTVNVQAEEDGPTVNGLFQGDDVDADDNRTSLSYAVVAGSGPVEGRLVNNFNGSFTFNPGPFPPLNTEFQDLREGETRVVTAEYRATDRHGLVSNNGTIFVTVIGRNDAPVAVDDLTEVNRLNASLDIAVLSNDTDIDGSPLDPSSILITSPPNHGSLTVNPVTGIVTYTPTLNYTGADTFRYSVADDEGAASLRSNEAEVRVTTTAFPIAVDDPGSSDPEITTLEGTPVTVAVLANDSDPDGSLIPSSVRIVTVPSHGTATVNPDGTVRYAPNEFFVGEDTFQYNVSDDLGAVSNTATVTIDVVRNSFPFTNPRSRLDVNDDGFITPYDVMLIVNHLNRVGSRLPTKAPPPYLDTNPDNLITPQDVRDVLAYLQMHGSGPAPDESQGAGGEGEFAGSAQLVAPWVGSLSPRTGTGVSNPADVEPLVHTSDPAIAPASAARIRSATVSALSRVTRATRPELEDLLDDLAAVSPRYEPDIVGEALRELLGG